jgi:parallel beta-helix repeat protein
MDNDKTILIFAKKFDKMKKISTIIAFLSVFNTVFAQQDIQKKLQRQFIMAKDGSTIKIEAGTFAITSTISLEGKKNIVIEGEGMDKTILNFATQTEGAEGIRVSNCENIVIRNLTVQESKGDAIKTMNVKNIVFQKVKTEWLGEPDEKNGGYGLYPVQCQGVTIDACEAIGASDAGIYVGQSQDIKVYNCKAYHNVAGIEIENSINAEVFDNEATENTGGILVFDLPDLIQKKGGNVKVYRNNIHHNNFRNFAPKGNIVATVPAGSGVMVLATNNVEIFDNQIINNNSASCSIISYYMTEIAIKDKEYYPYPTNITIRNNVFERENVRFQGKGRMKLLYRYKLRFGKNIPHIVYDGIVDKNTLDEKGNVKSDARICIFDNKNATFANLDAENGFKNINKDITKFACKK